MLTYNLSEFSKAPYGRYPEDGRFNATKFRGILKDKLIGAKEKKDSLKVNIDLPNYGIGSSFLEEAFGGLVRKGLFTKEELLNTVTPLLVIESELTFYITEINQYINDAILEEQ